MHYCIKIFFFNFQYPPTKIRRGKFKKFVFIWPIAVPVKRIIIIIRRKHPRGYVKVKKLKIKVCKTGR